MFMVDCYFRILIKSMKKVSCICPDISILVVYVDQWFKRQKYYVAIDDTIVNIILMLSPTTYYMNIFEHFMQYRLVVQRI